MQEAVSSPHTMGLQDSTGCVVLENTAEGDIPVRWKLNGNISRCLLTAEGMIEAETALPEVLPKESILTVEVTV